jgi:hypothetical protein
LEAQLRSAVVRPLQSAYRIEQCCACTTLPRLERCCATKVVLAPPTFHRRAIAGSRANVARRHSRCVQRTVCGVCAGRDRQSEAGGERQADACRARDRWRSFVWRAPSDGKALPLPMFAVLSSTIRGTGSWRSSPNRLSLSSFRFWKRKIGDRCRTPSPLWVISGHWAVQSPCPLYPQKRTFAATVGMSAKCH